MADDIDDLEIVDDEDQTLAVDDEDEEVSLDDDEEAQDESSEDEEDDLEPIRPPTYKPESNIYTVLLVLAFLAYATALGFVLSEMKTYCNPQDFMGGLFR